MHTACAVSVIALTAGACSRTTPSGTAADPTAAAVALSTSTTSGPATTAPTTSTPAPLSSIPSTSTPTPATTVPGTATAPGTTTAATAINTTAATTTSSTTSTTPPTTAPPLDVYDPACVVRVQPGDSLLTIVARFDDDTADVETVMAENGLTDDVIVPEQLIDVCVDNGIDDVTGETRPERNSAVLRREVVAQQEQLNRLFAGYGIRELLVDGISGPVTRQRLCAFRLAAGLPVSTEDMVAGSEEEQLLMSMTELPIPFTSALASPRWILIDRTCQIMFVGEGAHHLQFVFPTSTGEPGYETRDQKLTRAFKYNPALHNNGWHNSSTYPAAEDNPLNGNMYKPIYFDRGQAIHGANNVPTSPQSKGCARLRVEHQELLVNWLGLGDANGIITNKDRINVTVTVQGQYVYR